MTAPSLLLSGITRRQKSNNSRLLISIKWRRIDIHNHVTVPHISYDIYCAKIQMATIDKSTNCRKTSEVECRSIRSMS